MMILPHRHRERVFKRSNLAGWLCLQLSAQVPPGWVHALDEFDLAPAGACLHLLLTAIAASAVSAISQQTRSVTLYLEAKPGESAYGGLLVLKDATGKVVRYARVEYRLPGVGHDPPEADEEGLAHPSLP
jgi:hypothetical protein